MHYVPIQSRVPWASLAKNNFLAPQKRLVSFRPVLCPWRDCARPPHPNPHLLRSGPHLRPLRSLACGTAMAYGLAFAEIYRVEDSRIQAARWIFAEVPSGQNIGVETGGFSMQGLIDGRRYG